MLFAIFLPSRYPGVNYAYLSVGHWLSAEHFTVTGILAASGLLYTHDGKGQILADLLASHSGQPNGRHHPHQLTIFAGVADVDAVARPYLVEFLKARSSLPKAQRHHF